MLINYTLFVVFLLLFLYGFFPMNIDDNASKVSLPLFIKDYKFNISGMYNAEFEKAIIIIIDALRYDFITDKNTPFMWNQSHNMGCLSKVRVETPTVTLPRIKSFINGNIPQFSDVILNLIRNEEISDSLIHEATRKNKTIVFYGDDTWLKLLPGVFKRSEGTSSFYVNDYSEVDNNVTRNVVEEMKHSDWDIMILHYLGLDHIGHVNGPYSPLIKLKLQEMDAIVEYIYEESKKFIKSNFILVTGDHGMKDSGGHGGSTYSEMHVPLLLLGYNCNSTSINQIDIAPTLASLLSLEIPRSNIGIISTNLLPKMSPEKLLYLLYYNALHLSKKCSMETDLNSLIEKHYDFLTKKHNNPEKIIEWYKMFMHRISNTLKTNSTSQDLHILILSLLSVISIVLSSFNSKQKFEKVSCFFVFYIVLQIMFPTFRKIYYLVVIVQVIIIGYHIILLFRYLRKLKFQNNTVVFFLLLTFIQPFLFISSSFIEEEHQIWYFYGTTFVTLSILFYLKCINHLYNLSILLITFRFVKKINQTGDKWASLPDLKLFFRETENFPYLIAFFVFSLFILYLICLYINDFKKTNNIFTTIIVIFISLFHLWNKNPLVGRITWSLICLNYLLKVECKNFVVSWLLLSALLLQSYNVMLLPFTMYASHVIHKYVQSKDVKILLHLWLANILLFCQGHSNSLSSIDISVGYVGLNEYNPIYVVPQVLIHSYIFPILTYILAMNDSINRNYFVLHRLLSTCIMMFIVLLQRHHLFVWSVFAPKLLIESSHTLIMYLIVSLENLLKFEIK